MNSALLKDAPSLPSGLARELLKQALDFVLVLDEMDTVAHVFLSPDAGEHPLARAVGRPLRELLSIESHPKLDSLLSSNSMEEDSEYRWRHVNLLMSAEESLAVLAKYVEVKESSRTWRALLCRDLTPIGRMQKNLMKAQIEMENSVQRVQASAATGSSPWRQQVGVAPLASIRQHWLARLEQECVREALNRCRGDVRAAALLLGVSVEQIHQLMPPASSPPTTH